MHSPGSRNEQCHVDFGVDTGDQSVSHGLLTGWEVFRISDPPYFTDQETETGRSWLAQRHTSISSVIKLCDTAAWPAASHNYSHINHIGIMLKMQVLIPGRSMAWESVILVCFHMLLMYLFPWQHCNYISKWGTRAIILCPLWVPVLEWWIKQWGGCSQHTSI